MTARSLAIAVLVFGPMLVEAAVSRAREKRLRALGAVEPAGDVYRAMSVAYPGIFALMIAEGAWWALPVGAGFLVGVSMFAVAKALKVAAIAALGDRWSFRVLVLPGASLVVKGPYRIMRHPNYLAVVMEIVAAAVMAPAPVSGPASLLFFGQLLRRRMAHEERALGIGRSFPRPSRAGKRLTPSEAETSTGPGAASPARDEDRGGL
jgi:methyltransferase